MKLFFERNDEEMLDKIEKMSKSRIESVKNKIFIVGDSSH